MDIADPSVAAETDNLRVRIWRKLQKLGAVAVKNSVYTLPFNEKTHEDFQWLKQEITAEGGEAAVFRAGAVEGATEERIEVKQCQKLKTETSDYCSSAIQRCMAAVISITRKQRS
jgi:hypothetical protein